VLLGVHGMKAPDDVSTGRGIYWLKHVPLGQLGFAACANFNYDRSASKQDASIVDMMSDAAAAAADDFDY